MAKKSGSAAAAADGPTWAAVAGADIWNPAEVGSQIEGTLGDAISGTYGPMHTVETKADGSVTLPHLTVINSKLSGVEVGSLIRVTYLGEALSGAGRTYKDFNIEVATVNKGA